ncbi:MAG: hypothetical protein LUE86_00790 [Clostridiales bacterium]|nr:hypothetical protein [Clostridiales bacterium]
MKEKLLNNLGLKILSIFLAFFVWLVVVNVSNPVVTGSKEVTLEILNEQVLTDAGKTYEISGKGTTTVSYQVHTRDSYLIRASDFKATVDLADLYSVTGSVPVEVEIVNNRDLLVSVEAKPGVVRVETEDLQRKTFDLRTSTVGSETDGYVLTNISLSPAQVTVEGPTSQVGLISYVGVTLSKDNLDGSVSGVTTPIFYDANGNQITLSDRITVDTEEILYDLTVNKMKVVPIEYEVTGSVASGYQYIGSEINNRTAVITGTSETLNAITAIEISSEALDITGATGDMVVTISLADYLPEGVSLFDDGVAEVEITLQNEQLGERTLVLTGEASELQNASEDLIYEFSPSEISVVIRGLNEEIQDLGASDLGASINVTNLTTGNYTGLLRFMDSWDYDVISYTGFTMQVTTKSGVIVAGSPEEETDGQEETAIDGEQAGSEESVAEETAAETEATESESSENTEQKEG